MLQQVPYWKKAPFLRFLPPLVAGILFDSYWLSEEISLTKTSSLAWIGFLLAASLLFGTRFTSISIRHKLKWLFGLLINVMLLCLGVILFQQNRISNKPDWIGHALPETVAVLGSPATLASHGKKSGRVTFSVNYRITNNGMILPASGTILLYLPSQQAADFFPGDRWLISAKRIKPIKHSGNPGSFNYARYCQRKNIYHQVYLPDGDAKLVSKQKGFSISRLLAMGQISALRSIRQTVPEESRGLAMALLIGYRNEMDKDLLQAYTNTGVVHVIAVSGMHLGLIFLLLQNILLLPEKKYPIARWLKAIIILAITWWFSGIAGGAASITRAAFMFSVVLFARVINKPMDAVQSLSLGAFALLCYNPYWLWDAGFQLSFAALLSIVLYQPLIQPLADFRNKILQGIWQLTAVTISAQILTLPISIGQFHQAPMYFLVANLIAVPLSGIALITAIIQWILSSINIPISIAGEITGLLIRLMDAAILHINSLPGAVLNNLQWHPVQTWTAYFIIASFSLFLVLRYNPYLLLALLGTILFGAWHFKSIYEGKEQQFILIYHFPGHSMTELITGLESTRFHPPDSSIRPALMDAQRFYHLEKTIYKGAKIIRSGKFILGIPVNLNDVMPLLNVGADYLILGKHFRSISRFMDRVPPGCLVIMDGSISEWRAAEWSKQLELADIRYHNTWQSGALIIDL